LASYRDLARLRSLPTRRSSDLIHFSLVCSGMAYNPFGENLLIFSWFNIWIKRKSLTCQSGLLKFLQDRKQGIQPRCLPGQIMERSEEHTSELQSRENLVCRLLL